MLDLKKPFRLIRWTIFPNRLVIEDNSGEKHLEPKAMEMLVYLAEHTGETVSRETLIKEIWPGTYGSDEALSRIISILRTQLGDDTKRPSFIETVPKVGYRLISAPLPVSAESEVDSSFSIRTFALIMAVPAVFLLLAFYTFHSSPSEPGVEKQYTVAVLPFLDISAIQEQAFFGIGLTNEIIAGLNDSPLLRIVARRSLENMQAEKTGPEIDFYIEGTVGVVEDRVQVYAELVSGSEGMVIWSDTYQNPESNYLEIQQKLSSAIVMAMNSELGIDIETPVEPDVALSAYTLYLNGIFLSKLRGEEPLRASIEAFSNALAIEPTFDNARVGLAHA
ncbi:MAG: winged helix-turn-helix domain-containing protein [Gammaproteobacteria bacterium]|nr:winged helix-turn-helix domain-containing protein [Gammaproteobacteria bacterium]